MHYPRAAKGEEGEELFVVRRRIKGPLWWADAFCADRQGRYLSTHDDNTFGVGRELRIGFLLRTVLYLLFSIERLRDPVFSAPSLFGHLVVNAMTRLYGASRLTCMYVMLPIPTSQCPRR